MRRLYRSAYFVALVAAWVILEGCAATPVPVTRDRALVIASCQREVDMAIFDEVTCTGAQTRINAAPVCREIYPRGMDLGCKGDLR